MQERTQVLATSVIAMASYLIVLGWHFCPYATTIVTVTIAITSTGWFFFLVYRSLWRKMNK